MPDQDGQALLLQVAYDLRALERQNARLAQTVARGANAAERPLRNLGGNVNVAGLDRLGNALRSTFNETQNRLVSEGTRSVGLFGAALSALGPPGIAAAVAIGGVALAMGQAMRTAEWAEQLGDTAQALRLTTTQVQELDFAALHAGMPIEAMRTSITSLNTALGAAQAGGRMGRRTQAVFDALGIDANTIRNTRDVSELLPRLADGLQRIAQSSPAEAAALGERLGINSELLQELEQGRAHFESLTESAHRYGLVMSEEAVAESARAADAMRETAGVIDAELRTAFANLAPVIIDASHNLADSAIALGEFTQRAGDAYTGILAVIDAMGQVPDLRRTGDAFSQIPGQVARFVGGPMGQVTGAMINGAVSVGRGTRMDESAMRFNDNEDRDIRQAWTWHQRTPAHPLFPGSGGGGARRRGGGGRTLTPTERKAAAIARAIGQIYEPAVNTVDRSTMVDLNDLGGQILRVSQSAALRDDLAQATAGFEEQRVQFRTSIRAGLEEAIHGGWPGLARYMATQLQQHLLDTLADTLATVFQQAMQGNTSSGGIGGWISAGISALSGGGGGVPKFASGTPGGMAMVGEFGKELAFLPKGTEIANASATRALSLAGRARGGGPTYFIDARGSIGPDEIFAAINATGAQARQFAVNTAMGAFSAARAQIPQDMSLRARRRLA